jgi:serine beta-lactamase-like protein LACTB, mitochondrial
MKLIRHPRCAAASIFMCLNLAVPPAPPAFAQDALSNATFQARSIIEKTVAPKVPGVGIAVTVDGAVVWSEGFGYADVAAKAPVTRATRFRIGSVSKPLTAAGLALLVERGQLDLDAPVQKYIPDFPEKSAPITLRLLAGHLSGIRNYRGSEAASGKPWPNLRSALKVFENDPLESPPGTKFSYSSYNWNVIGVAMEAAAKQDFLHYMEDKVFKPLGMTNTGPDLAGAADPCRADFYETDASGKFIVAPRVDMSSKWPSGGLLSTADDLVLFGSALLRPGFLKPASAKLLFASQTTTDGKPVHYGVGWFIGRSIVYHGGDSVGGTSVLMLHPASRTAVAILCNKGHIILDTQSKPPVMTQKSDLSLITTAQKIAQTFAPLHVKP